MGRRDRQKERPRIVRRPLTVATEDRAYAYSVDEQFPLSNDELARIADQSIEPELADGDWAGAAIAAASGLEAASGETSSDGDGGGSSVWLWLLLGGLALLGLIWWLASRSRGRPKRAPVAAEGDEVGELSTDELSKRGSSLLVEVDDAVKTSEQELAFATAQFGDEAAAPFAAAVESAKADLAKAFRLRREVDDSTKEDEAQRRAMLTEIITLTQGGSDRLDAEAERVDELRHGAERARAPRRPHHPSWRARNSGAGRRGNPGRTEGDVRGERPCERRG